MPRNVTKMYRTVWGGAQELVWRLKRGPVVKEMVPEGRGHGIQSPKNGGDASRIAAVQRVKA